jgi:hypothetical protein
VCIDKVLINFRTRPVHEKLPDTLRGCILCSVVRTVKQIYVLCSEY